MSEAWALARSDIGLRCWEDGCIAYQPLTGETHMLTPQAGRLLDLLREDGRTTEALMSELADGAAPPELAEALNTWLLQLSEARLICRLQS
ncbi:MAG: HPr-rel-A system PqqD family peptide chaperone [Pseudomonadota bacterium]|nr:HPr-rel-A system PqqD family peptide chaperone [Pseudomonadota bacterium]